MLRSIRTRLRDWIVVADPEERIEGSGEAIADPQHRRSPAATRELDRLRAAHNDHRDDRE
ncbi:hypothetical protein [Halosolutus gelatinilyticus]|uniref:hypothetical protein n=1 Tax=Halosolutus gelatinilyticus TaxID=2931975 RepID=UPI001FF595FE|nr:hypothetical protein [Halosolutus gelatinilyticus]